MLLRYLMIVVMFLYSLSLFASDGKLLIELQKKPSNDLIFKIKNQLEVEDFKRFDNFASGYFERLYELKLKKGQKVNYIIEKINELVAIKKIEKTFEVSGFSLEIPREAKRFSQDRFSNYQWGLFNQGQRILKDLDDIHSERIPGVKNADIGWINLSKSLDNKMKNQVVVAVVDSGVDLDHPDLKDAIIKNEVECEDGGLPFSFDTDKDNNGYNGDCMGWNFASDKKKGDGRTYDDVGHGTHIAGIISATSNNKIGTSGLSSKIKILPVKVLHKKESGSGKMATGTISDRIAKGILYAVKRDVDVINLSLGWPLSLDTNYLREAVKAALDLGITVVAASGNNNNDAQIFPCAYEGVICVGASTVNGKMANFTNFGGHVDVLAPGDNILSTYPTKLTPEIFSVRGYEFKNGTSQASPYISGVAAVLKSLYKGISNDELYARMIGTARTWNYFGSEKRKYVSNGLVHLEKAINKSPRPVIRPIFKELNDILLDFSDGKGRFSFKLPIKNFWKKSSSFTVQVAFNRKDIVLKKKVFHFNGLESNEKRFINLEGMMNNIDSDNNTLLTVYLSSNGKFFGIYNNALKIVSKAMTGLNWIKLPINLKDSPGNEKVRVGLSMRGRIRSMLSTVDDHFYKLDNPRYYVEKKNKNALELVVLQQQNGEMKPIKNNLLVPNSSSLLSILVVDINYDGKLDYFVRSMGKIGEEKFIKYSFFNEEGLPLFKEKYSHWKFIPETVVLNMKTTRFLPYYFKPIGKVALPLFISIGQTPKDDLNPDPWAEAEDNNIKDSHLFYFMPEIDEDNSVILRTKIIDRYDWIEEITKELSLRWNDEITLLDLLPQSYEQMMKGKSRALISIGVNYSKKLYVADLSLVDKRPRLRLLEGGRVNLEGHNLYPVIGMDNGINYFEDSTYIGHENVSTVRVSSFDGPYRLKYSSIIRRENKRDHILGLIASYKKADKVHSFLHTKSNLLFHSVNQFGKSTISKRPITRFSFLPGNLFHEMFYPIVVGGQDDNRPALYVDSTQLNRNDVYVLVPDKRGRLTSPIKYNVKVPDNCKAMNPILTGEMRKFSFSFICEENKKWSFRYLPL